MSITVRFPGLTLPIKVQFSHPENKSFNLAHRLMGFYALLMKILAPNVLTEVICSPLYLNSIIIIIMVTAMVTV